MKILTALTWISSLSFIYFGIGCFVSDFIISEFNRYGLPKFRTLTGSLQLLGSAGLLIGLYYNPKILLFASLGLCLLMICGFVVRLKISDDFLKCLPSFSFAVLNLIIAVKTFLVYFKD
ncbi:MAG: hypothetical protein ACI897_000575 [Flavobacteriales bacterium]|jgi:hypothetical protein